MRDQDVYVVLCDILVWPELCTNAVWRRNVSNTKFLASVIIAFRSGVLVILKNSIQNNKILEC